MGRPVFDESVLNEVESAQTDGFKALFALTPSERAMDPCRSSLLRARIAPQQRFYRRLRRELLVQHAIHLRRDRHVDVARLRQPMQFTRARHTFGLFTDLGQHIGELAPLTEPQTDAPIA